MSDRYDATGVDLEAVGGFVAEHLDGAVDRRRALEQRARLVAASDQVGARRTATWWMPLSLCAAALVAWWAWSAWPRAASVVTTSPATPSLARAGEWLQAPARGDAALSVGAGAKLSLHDGARGRVAQADAEQVAIVLEEGRIEAEVDPAAQRAVTIEAGPHRVAVVGTVFTVQWQPAEGGLSVIVTRGRVEVHTPASSAPIAVDAGRRLQVTRDGAVSLTSTTSVPAAVDDEPEPPIELVPDASPVRSNPDAPRVRPSARTRDEEPAPSWRALADDGRYREALAAVEAAGFDAALATWPVASLEQLGDAARLAGAPTRADAVYRAIRKRFAGTTAAARAAFQLGRQAADAKREPQAAVRWLRTYLEEAPQGSFAKLARGRLIGALIDAGDRSGAREAARIYLDAYPDGPHAKMAAALLDSP